jgi:pimeloyl-ACP methyl ester carboxylesterase
MVGYIASPLVACRRWNQHDAPPPRACNDIDRPLSYEQMADDVAALLLRLQIGEADVFGFSMGGAVALQLAIRHPGLVRKLVVASASYTSEGLYPEVGEAIETITPELFEGTPCLMNTPALPQPGEEGGCQARSLRR